MEQGGIILIADFVEDFIHIGQIKLEYGRKKSELLFIKKENIFAPAEMEQEVNLCRNKSYTKHRP